MIGLVNNLKNVLRNSPLRQAIMAIRHQGLHESDFFLASYPRSGNTWLRSLLTSCIFGEAMQDFSDKVDPVIPIVGYHRAAKPLLKNTGRLIKTHEACRREYRNAVWIVRDPRDVVLSEFKLEIRSRHFSGSFDAFVDQFVNVGRIGPPDWATLNLSWLNRHVAEPDSVLLVRFEDLKSDTPRELRRVLEFLSVDYDQAVIDLALTQNSLNSMSERHAQYDSQISGQIDSTIPAVNQGAVGGWREKLSSETVDKIEASFGNAMDQLGYERVST